MRQRMLVLIVLLLAVPFVTAPKPEIPTSISSGLDIVHPIISTVRVGSSIQLQFEVNTMNGGLVVTNANCTIHVYNGTGFDIYTASTKTVTHGRDYEFFIHGGNLTQPGEYGYLTYCNASVLEEQSIGGTIVTVHRGGWVEDMFVVANQTGGGNHETYYNGMSAANYNLVKRGLTVGLRLMVWVVRITGVFLFIMLVMYYYDRKRELAEKKSRRDEDEV